MLMSNSAEYFASVSICLVSGALGPEVIPVYAVSDIFMNLAVGCDLSAMLVVTFPAREHHHPLAGTKLYCWLTEACL